MQPWPQLLHGLFEVQRPVQVHTDVLCLRAWCAFWNTVACQWTRSAPDSRLSRLQEIPFRLTNDLLQRHPQQTFSFDWRIYSLMNCWAKWWVGPCLVGVCIIGENLSRPYNPAPDILLKIVPTTGLYSCRMQHEAMWVQETLTCV